MTKSQLIRLLSYKNTSLTPEIISKSVDVILNEISKAVLNEKQVEIRGFGQFSNRARNAKLLRHPGTSRLIRIAPYRTMHYSYSAKLFEEI
jgi:integration host factor subunit beta